MKKAATTLIVLLMATAMVFTSCNHVSPQIKDEAEGETAPSSESSTEIDTQDNKSSPVITDAEILIVESKFMSSGIGTEKVSMPELLSDTASGSETLFYYSLLRTFTECEQVGEPFSSLTFAGETFDVTYARSEKLNNVPDETIGIYGKYDVYFDENNVEYHVRADGQVVFMYPSSPFSSRYIGNGDTAVGAAEEVLKKVLGDNADNYKLYAHGNYDTYQCVEFHY